MLASIRTISYIKRMISLKKWTNILPPIKYIVSKLGVSSSTVNKAIKILENQKVIENNGLNTYVIISKKLQNLYSINKQFYYLNQLNKNLKIIDMLNTGGKIIDNYLFTGNKNKLIVNNLSSQKIITTSEIELLESKKYPITTKILLSLSGKQLENARNKYLKQKELIKISDIISKNKKELCL